MNKSYNTRRSASLHERVPGAERMQKSLLFEAHEKALKNRWHLT